MNDNSLSAQFFNDSVELLADAEEYVLQLENEGSDEDTVHSLFRLFHTLKGNSNMVGEGDISSLTHALESQYELVRNGKRELSEELIQSTFEVIDLLNIIAQDGDSAPHKGKIVEMTQQFNSPIKDEEKSKKSSRETKSSGSQARTEGAGGASSGASSGGSTGADGSRAGGGLLTESEWENLSRWENWSPILTAFYTLEKHSYDLAAAQTSDEEEDLLMELGMAAIELRSSIDEASERLEHLAMYLEKFTATVSRQQIPYSDIDYELLFVVLNDFRRAMWERLYALGVFRHLRVDSVDGLDEVPQRIGEDGVLYIVEIMFKKNGVLRQGPLFEKLNKVIGAAPERVVLISPRMQLMQKATALLDQALEGFPKIAVDIEEGVRTLLLTED